MQIDIAISHNTSCMDIAHLGGEIRLACGEKARTLLSVNIDRIVHKQTIALEKWNFTHFLFNLYLGFGLDLVGNCKSTYHLHS